MATAEALSSTAITDELEDWGSFTLQRDQGIDERVASHLRLVVMEVLKMLGDRVLAIVLGGGFGRGEGAVLVEDGEVELVSDYDLLIVTAPMGRRQRLDYARRLDLLGRELAKKLGLSFRMELELSDVNALRSRDNLIINYELKNGHKVLWGQKDILDAMPSYSAQELPLEEGTMLLWNRGGELLRVARLIWQRGPLTREQLKMVVFFCIKVNLATGDSLLLLEGKYHHLYSQRRERIQVLPEARTSACGHDILPGYLEASRFKLQPNLKPFSDRDLWQWWFELKEVYLRFYLWFEGQRTGLEFANWGEYLNSLNRHDFPGLLTVLRNYRRNLRIFGLSPPWQGRKLWLCSFRPEVLLRSALLSLLIAKTDQGIESHHLERTAYLLGKEHGGNSGERWLSLASRYISCWHE